MTSMTRTTVGVAGGVDTHGQSHHAAVIDQLGRQLGDCEFPASPAGYGALVERLQGHGELDRVGVEGTGAYGAGLARHLREAGIFIVEVDRPDRRARRAHGKSDPLDAYSAARAALSGAAAAVPKLRDGRVEAIRALRMARSSAVKARSQATNQLKSLIVTRPAQLREQLRHLPTLKLIAACARLRLGHQLGDTEHATKTALRRPRRVHRDGKGPCDLASDAGSLIAGRMNELLVGYARVSAEQQDLTAQRDRLHVLGVGDDRIYVDHGLTGTNRDRPGLRLGLGRTVAARRWCHPRRAHEVKRQARLRRLDP